MSARPVDVLAVLDASISACNDATCPDCIGIAKARAAVAELIEKADNAARILHNVIQAGQIGAGYQTNLDDLHAALARCGAQA